MKDSGEEESRRQEKNETRPGTLVPTEVLEERPPRKGQLHNLGTPCKIKFSVPAGLGKSFSPPRAEGLPPQATEAR